MEPSPDLHFAAMTQDSAAASERPSVADASLAKGVAMVPCNCAVYQRIAELQQPGQGGGWRIDEAVSVPSAAHGYVDPLTGKQVGSFMTYIISFLGVSPVIDRAIADRSCVGEPGAEEI